MPTNLNYRVGLVQMSCGPDPDANLDKAADRVREAAREGAEVICLPELFRAQYFCQREDIALFDLAEPIPGPSTERLGAVARRYIPNCYGLTTSPLHARLPTDRLVAEWELASPRVEACLRGDLPPAGPHAVRIAVPLEQALARFRDPETGLALQTRVREEFQHWFERGYVAVSLEVSGHTAFYILVPGNDPSVEAR